MVFRKGENKVAIVQLDLLGFPSVLCDRVHKQVPRIPADNILIGSTHTHSAPDCYGFPGGKAGHSGNLKYMDFVCNQAAKAINQALDNLQPASLKIATGEAKGKIAYNYYAPELYDPRMSVIQAITPDGKTIGTLVNYAIHPEVLGNGVGSAAPTSSARCATSSKPTGGMGMFMNGAQGGMITADNRRLDQPPIRSRPNGTTPAPGKNACASASSWPPKPSASSRTPPTERPRALLLCHRVKFPVESDADVDMITRLAARSIRTTTTTRSHADEPGQSRQRPDPDHPRRSAAQHRLLPQAADEGREQPAVRPHQRRLRLHPHQGRLQQLQALRIRLAKRRWAK